MAYIYVCFDCGITVDPDIEGGVPFARRTLDDGRRRDVVVCVSCYANVSRENHAKRRIYGNPTPVKNAGAVARPQPKYKELTMKVCTGCQQSKPLGEFYREKRTRDGKRSKCKDCTNRKNKDYVKTSQGKVAKQNAQKKYRASCKGKNKAYEYNRRTDVKKKRRAISRKPKNKILRKKYWQSGNGKAVNQKHKTSTKGREKTREYNSLPDVKERKYKHSQSLKSKLRRSAYYQLYKLTEKGINTYQKARIGTQGAGSKRSHRPHTTTR